MEITFETNGKAFIGWIIELPGAYIRGKTIVEAKERIDDEITSYQQWLDLPLRKEIITHENIFQSKSTIEDADSDILLGYDINDYNGIENLKTDCENVLLSAKKFDGIYKKCNHKNIVDKIWVGKTFFGELPSTIEKQLEHILGTQKWYLNNIEADMDSEMDIINGRIKIVEAIIEKYKKERNKIHINKMQEESWTIRKVIRRLIWHDRFHGKAIEEMEIRLNRD